MSQYEMLEELDVPFPTGGCFGLWGYDLKHFTEPKLRRSAANDLELPDCHVGFYGSLVVFDHHLGQIAVVSTGLDETATRDESRAGNALEFWRDILNSPSYSGSTGLQAVHPYSSIFQNSNNLSRDGFLSIVRIAQQYIRAGDIYQVNLARRMQAKLPCSAWQLFKQWTEISPAPFSAFLDCGDFQLVSASPEMFLRMSGPQIITRPIKGTRGRSNDPNQDAQLSYELQTSAKEMAELIMITDLLRNDLGRVCEFGSIRVPELVRLERYAHVQHLVSTVEGRLRQDVSHFAAFASCFPGGSITGAPKFRAMEIIDELEPVSRGPYTGALGYLGFNRESQLSIIIRTAICAADSAWFYSGAGIVADSDPEMEYNETEIKAQGFMQAIVRLSQPCPITPAK